MTYVILEIQTLFHLYEKQKKINLLLTLQSFTAKFDLIAKSMHITINRMMSPNNIIGKNLHYELFTNYVDKT